MVNKFIHIYNQRILAYCRYRYMTRLRLVNPKGAFSRRPIYSAPIHWFFNSGCALLQALISELAKYINSQVAIRQPSMQRYLLVVRKTMSGIGVTELWLRVFGKAKTDFERIYFHLRAIKQSDNGMASPYLLRNKFLIIENLTICNHKGCKHGLEQLTQLAKREEIEKINGKSDQMSEICRLFTALAWNDKKINEALSASITAVFCAISPEQTVLAFVRRCNILYNLGLINEAVADGKYALTVRLCNKIILRGFKFELI